MRAKTVRQIIAKQACFRGQIKKNPSQTGLSLSNGFCSNFYNFWPEGLKFYTVTHNAPGKLSIKHDHLPKMHIKIAILMSKYIKEKMNYSHRNQWDLLDSLHCTIPWLDLIPQIIFAFSLHHPETCLPLAEAYQWERSLNLQPQHMWQIAQLDLRPWESRTYLQQLHKVQVFNYLII